ncbi:ABC transporter permease subunit [Echinimonas agarilytica]|uniref:ABC transporter permease n=1 Tax=Echinimonas agarilytica TaxID=1215918 RepID=A0AA41W5V9_9GAMM|nr:ABC transporter permease subunit [Echinimonas agarilytica]MCM2679639.1 ABC transporter permease [Echinimonas agarilytica]
MKDFLSVMWAIVGREVGGYFHAPIAYVFIFIFLIISSLLTFVQSGFFEAGEATLAYAFFKWHPWLYAFLVPAIGMRVWTEENRQGTIELLLTHPVSLGQLVLAKYLAALVPLLVTLLLTGTSVLTVEYLGDPDYGPIVTGYLGSVLLGASFLALSCCCSALTRSPVIAFIFGAALCVMLVLIGSKEVGEVLVRSFPEQRWLVESIAATGIAQYFAMFRRGLLATQAVGYFTVLTTFALLANYQILRWKQG